MNITVRNSPPVFLPVSFTLSSPVFSILHSHNLPGRDTYNISSSEYPPTHPLSLPTQPLSPLTKSPTTTNTPDHHTRNFDTTKSPPSLFRLSRLLLEPSDTMEDKVTILPVTFSFVCSILPVFRESFLGTYTQSYFTSQTGLFTDRYQLLTQGLPRHSPVSLVLPPPTVNSSPLLYRQDNGRLSL